MTFTCETATTEGAEMLAEFLNDRLNHCKFANKCNTHPIFRRLVNQFRGFLRDNNNNKEDLIDALTYAIDLIDEEKEMYND